MCMTCNPYDEKPFPKILINEKKLTPNSSLARVEKKPLQDSLYPSSSWTGFFQKAFSSLGVNEFTLEFRGTLEDFRLLKDAYDSFANVNCNLKVDFVFDSALAADILPEFRKNFLYNKLKLLKETGWEWHSENLNAALEKCLEFLAHEENSDTEKILACKSVLEEYFRENFEKDKNDVWRQNRIENLNRWRREKFENGQQLSLIAANIRCSTLFGFHSRLCGEHAGLDGELSKISGEMANIIYECYFGKMLLQEERNPASLNCPEPDYFLPKIEINGVTGYWIEETEALILKEKFRSALQAYYDDLKTYHALRVQNLLNCLNEHTSDFYLNEWMERFRNNCYVQENITSFDVPDTKCTVTDYVPAYWEGQEARQITRTYIDVVEYEQEYRSKFISAMKDKLVINFMSNVSKFFFCWEKDLDEYREIIKSLESAEEFSQRMEELRKITERLTSIDCKLNEEK